MADLREAVSTEELAKVIGIHSRQVQNWAAGRNRPQGENREQLLGVYYLVQRLRDVLSARGHRDLAALPQPGVRRASTPRPARAGEYERVLAAVERLADGTPS